MLRFITLLLTCLIMTACDSSTQLKPLKPAAVILAFGDSLTSGVGATKNTSYPAYLQQITGYTVINAGVSGEDTKNGLARISKDLDTYQPNLVILCLGGNDFLRKQPENVVKENLKQIIQTIQQRGIQIVLIAAPKPLVTLAVPSLYAELGEELSIPVNTTLLPTLEGDSAYKSDYIHLNQKGYQLFAQGIANWLKDLGAF